jgi:CheY-like chemotaxis protein
LIEQVIELTRARWGDMPQRLGVVIDMRKDLTVDLPPVMGSESEIRETLTNLIFNAVDAMPEGGTMTVRTLLPKGAMSWRREPGPARVHLEVADSGIGMDEDTRRRCLEPFFTTKGDRGTGLGLAMVYGTAQRHGADLEIDSALGKGTTMRLTFAAVATAAPAAAGPLVRSVTVPPLRLLIVDDDPFVLDSMRKILVLEKHTVATATDGQACLDAFRAALANGEQFDAVITDLGMPYMDGNAVARGVKQMSPATPVILLTGWGQQMSTEEEAVPHVDHVLGKPARLNELREALAQCAARRAA